MSILIGAAVFLFGTAIGSFLNVVVFRLGERPLSGRSQCPYCGKELRWLELIPIVSYAFQRGRCRRCGARLSLQYPLVEALAGLVFVLIFWRLLYRFPAGIPAEFFFGGGALWGWPLVVLWWYYGSALIAISAYDARRYVIPDAILLPATAVAVAGVGYQEILRVFRATLFPPGGIAFSGPASLLLGSAPFGVIGGALAGIFVAAGILAAFHYLSRGRAMGFGDVKLGIFMGLVLGWPDTFIALLVAFVAGALWSIGAMLARKKTMRSMIPFGPFLAFGIIAAMLAGDMILNFYSRVFPAFLFL